MDELRLKRAANFENRNVHNCMKLWYARFACYKLRKGHSSIELKMYKQYIDELRAKRASNFEAMNVQNYMKLWYMYPCVLQIKKSIELEMYKQYGWIAHKARRKLWS